VERWSVVRSSTIWWLDLLVKSPISCFSIMSEEQWRNGSHIWFPLYSQLPFYMKEGDEQSPGMVRLHLVSLVDSSMACSSGQLSIPVLHELYAPSAIPVEHSIDIRQRIKVVRRQEESRHEKYLGLAEDPYNLDCSYLFAQFLIQPLQPPFPTPSSKFGTLSSKRA
jgi:hypothetical protein